MTAPVPARRRAILIFVLNRSGVLNKISMLIRRKMYNVETLTACATREPGISRMTLTLRENSDAKTHQVIKQLERMTEVIAAKELDINQSFWREVAIVKFEADDHHIEQLRQTYPIEVLDRLEQSLLVVQLAGTSQRIDGFLKALGPEKVVEVARSGFTALEK